MADNPEIFRLDDSFEKIMKSVDKLTALTQLLKKDLEENREITDKDFADETINKEPDNLAK